MTEAEMAAKKAADAKAAEAQKTTQTQQAAQATSPQPASVAQTTGAAPALTGGAAQQAVQSGDKDSIDPLLNPQSAAIPEDIAAANRTPTERAIANSKREVTIVGRQGGPFNIDGEGFGTAAGSVSVGGRGLKVTRWNDTSIKGELPPDLESGDIVVTVPGGQQRRGTFVKR